MSAPLLIIAAGGTGGHMFPAQALAEVMLTRGWRVRLSTDARGASHAGNFPAEVERRVVRSASPTRGGILAKLALPLQVGLGVISATFALLRDRPTAAVGFGGYPAIPAMTAAWLLRLPRLIHEQNAVLGQVNQIFARRVPLVACGSWPTELPPGVEGRHVGNPIRAAVRAVAGAAFHAPGEGALHLLVFGGSQGARVMRIVPDAIALLPKDVQSRLVVSQQARDEDEADMRKAYRDLGIHADIRPFFNDMPDRLVQAHLVIARSGASSVADITAVGRPAIFVPLAAAVRDEQTANARGPAEAGAAKILQEAELTAERLAQHIAAILSDPKAAIAAAEAARHLGKPDAADALADLVEKLV